MGILYKYMNLCVYIFLSTNIYSQCIPVQGVLDVNDLGCGNYKYHIEMIAGSNPWVLWNVNGKTQMGSMDTIIRFTNSQTIYSKAVIGNDCGSISLEKNFINVYEKPKILSIDQQVENCSEVKFKVNFSGNTDGLSYQWNGDDLFTTQLEEARHTYMLPGKFNYTVQVDNQCGDQLFYQGKIEIKNNTTCSSGPDFTTCYDDGKLLLHGLPAGGQWFGIGLKGDLFIPEVAGEGKHELVYKYRENGCIAFDTTYITVERIQPSAEFIQFKKTAPVYIDFISNTYNKKYEIIWDFGDGKTSFISNPTHEYTQPGIYFPVIELYNPITGCRSVNVFSNPLIVEAAPEVDDNIVTYNNKINILPNPSNGIIRVNVDKKQGVKYFTVQVLDLTGQVLLYYPKIEQDQFDINIPQLASNCYIVRINTDDGSQYSQKLISIR